MSAAAALALDLTSDAACLPDVRRRVQEWASAHGWNDQQAGELALALDETITNIIRHGYEGRPGEKILVHGEASIDPAHGPVLELRVRDFGRQVDPVTICGRDLNDIRPGGLGVHIIRAMTSTVEYQRASGGGMLVILRKYRDHTADMAARVNQR